MRILPCVVLVTCVALPHVAPAQAPKPVQASGATVPDPGWGKSGGTVGLIGAASVLVLAGVAEAVNAGGDNASAIGAAAVLLSIPAVTVAALGGGSVRGVPGNPGMRMGGWIAYGLAIADGIALVGLGIADVTVPPGPTIACGVLGALGISFISFDAIQSAGAAARARQRGSVQVSPSLGAIRTAEGHLAPTLGFTLRF